MAKPDRFLFEIVAQGCGGVGIWGYLFARLRPELPHEILYCLVLADEVHRGRRRQTVPPDYVRGGLHLIDERRFGSGVVQLRHRMRAEAGVPAQRNAWPAH